MSELRAIELLDDLCKQLEDHVAYNATAGTWSRLPAKASTSSRE